MSSSDLPATRTRSSGLPIPARSDVNAATRLPIGGPQRLPIDLKQVSGKLNSLFDGAKPEDKGLINDARHHIIGCALKGERDVTIDLPHNLMADLQDLELEGISIRERLPRDSGAFDYPPPQQPVVRVPEMKVPPAHERSSDAAQRPSEDRRSPKERSAIELNISKQLEKLGRGMAGYGSSNDRDKVIEMTCGVVAKQIADIPDEGVRQDLTTEMAGALLQMVNIDPKRTSLVNRMIEQHLPSCASMKPEAHQDRAIEQRTNRLLTLSPAQDGYAVTLKQEFGGIIAAIEKVEKESDRLLLMGNLVNRLIQRFRENQNPANPAQCRLMHQVVTEIIDGGPQGAGGLWKAVYDTPASHSVLQRQKTEYLAHMQPASVSVHLNPAARMPQSEAAARAAALGAGYSPEQIAALSEAGLL
jgi:hypothetical protein